MSSTKKLKSIVAAAPGGATHWDSESYWKCTSAGYACWFGKSWENEDVFDWDLRSLSDIETIIKQADEIAELREVIQIFANGANGLDGWQKAARMAIELLAKGESK